MMPGLAIPMWLFDGLPEIEPEGGDVHVGVPVVVVPEPLVAESGDRCDGAGDRLGLT